MVCGQKWKWWEGKGREENNEQVRGQKVKKGERRTEKESSWAEVEHETSITEVHPKVYLIYDQRPQTILQWIWDDWLFWLLWNLDASSGLSQLLVNQTHGIICLIRWYDLVWVSVLAECWKVRAGSILLAPTYVWKELVQNLSVSPTFWSHSYCPNKFFERNTEEINCCYLIRNLSLQNQKLNTSFFPRTQLVQGQSLRWWGCRTFLVGVKNTRVEYTVLESLSPFYLTYCSQWLGWQHSANLLKWQSKGKVSWLL